MGDIAAFVLTNRDLLNFIFKCQKLLELPGKRVGDMAANMGHISLMKSKYSERESSQHQTYGMEYSENVVDGVAGRGCLFGLKYLLEELRFPVTIRTLACAAEAGHLPVVKYLHFNHSAPTTVRAMDRAAANNHLDVVKFLHENRSEGCTSAAMNRAAKNNHLDVVKWLWRNRREGCTEYALIDAAGLGHGEMVEFLICEVMAFDISVDVIGLAMKRAERNGHCIDIKGIISRGAN